jgi:hypothetical protein
VAKRVPHGLLSDTKGAEFDLRSKSCLGPEDSKFGVRLGFVFDIGNETRKCGNEPKLVKGRRAQVSRESPQSGGGVQRQVVGFLESIRHGARETLDLTKTLEMSSQEQEKLEWFVVQLASQSPTLILFGLDY